jgi:hypothetical protein
MSDLLADAELALEVAADAQRRRKAAQRMLDGFAAFPNPGLWQPPKSLRLAIRCTARRTNGKPCRAFAVRGCWVCVAHGAGSRKVREAGQARLFRLGVERYWRAVFDAGREESWAMGLARLFLAEADAEEAAAARGAPLHG